MGGQPTKIQTDYTKGGKAISDTAIPLYQTNLKRMDEYLSNPSARTDEYLQKYFTDTAAENDLLRQYKRDVGNMTANNYAATGGGYSSLNQQNYDDTQRYYNDLASRLQQAGVSTAYNMGANDYNNMLNANNAYYNAYGLGKEYSDIQQYNNLVDQYNSTAWMGVAGDALNTVGQGVSMIPGWGTVIGGAMQLGGSALSNSAVQMPAELTRGGSSGVTQGAYGTSGNQRYVGNTLGEGFNKIYDWLQNKNAQSAGNVLNSTSQARQNYWTGNYPLYNR